MTDAPPSRLSSVMGNAAATPVNTEGVKARGWRENRILVVPLADPRLSEDERALVKRLGSKLYGD